VSHLVKVVVDDLTQVDQGILLDLDVGILVNLYTRGVHNTEITDVVLAIFADNHELRLPELLVVGDLVVVGLAFTDLENTLSTVDGDLEILQLFCVDSLECHGQSLLCGLFREGFKGAALEIQGDAEQVW